MDKLIQEAEANLAWANEWREGIKTSYATLPEPFKQLDVVKWFRNELDETILEQFLELVRDFHEVFTKPDHHVPRSGAVSRLNRYHSIWQWFPDELTARYPDVCEIFAYWYRTIPVCMDLEYRTSYQHGPVIQFADMQKNWLEGIPKWHSQVFGD